jgi:hypothetical protein
MPKKYLSFARNFTFRIFIVSILLFSISTQAQKSLISTPSAVTIQVDAAANRHAINPLIYGTAYATIFILKVWRFPQVFPAKSATHLFKRAKTVTHRRC